MGRHCMVRRILLARAILAGFLICAAFLPLAHNCYDVSLTRPEPESGCFQGAPAIPSSTLFEKAVVRTLPGEEEPCLACIWSHHLFLDAIVVNPELPQPAVAVCAAAEPVSIRPFRMFDAASRRGPPVTA